MQKTQETKLFIQIPCFNEEHTLPLVIADIPHKIEGVDKIYTLIIDDGSTDETVHVAQQIGIDYIIKNGSNLGLAKSYSRGIEACLYLGADIIVNTDGDNQYKGEDIVKLIKPIIDNKADIVIGCRDISGHEEFTKYKKFLQKIGSSIVRRMSGTEVPDTTSGFRALNRKAAITLTVMSNFSYTLETLIQAGRSGLNVQWVSINTNPKRRESRLYKSVHNFVFLQLKTLLKIYLFYCPMRFFVWLASLFFLFSMMNAGRILYFLFLVGREDIKFKIGSGILLLFTTIITVLCIVAGLLGSVLSGIRFLMIDLRSRMRNMELKKNIKPIDIDVIAAPEFFKWTALKDKMKEYDIKK